MVKDVGQIEKNVSASFAYVKKDMLMLNDAFSDIHDKIQQLSLDYVSLSDDVKKLKNEKLKAPRESEIQNLSMNHAMLLGEIKQLRKEVLKLSKKKVVKKKK